jgi:hypothetical protein
MMLKQVIALLLVFGLPAAIVLVRMRFAHREKMATLVRAPEQTRALEARLERVEQAVDAIALEVERVGEGQRFLTKLLAERAAPHPNTPASPRERVSTPH